MFLIDIHSNIGTPKNIKKLNKETRYLSARGKQKKKIQVVSKLNGLDVEMIKNEALNQCKDIKETVVSREMSNVNLRKHWLV